MVILNSTSEVIDALGGTENVAQITGRKYNAVWMWRAAKNFPPDTFLILRHALEAQQQTAPASLWRMVEAAS